MHPPAADAPSQVSVPQQHVHCQGTHHAPQSAQGKHTHACRQQYGRDLAHCAVHHWARSAPIAIKCLTVAQKCFFLRSRQRDEYLVACLCICPVPRHVSEHGHAWIPRAGSSSQTSQERHPEAEHCNEWHWSSRLGSARLAPTSYRSLILVLLRPPSLQPPCIVSRPPSLPPPHHLPEHEHGCTGSKRNPPQRVLQQSNRHQLRILEFQLRIH